MAERSSPSTVAAGGIWAGSLLGSWAMALAVLGAINEAVIGCDSDPSGPGTDSGGGGLAGWVILVVASLVPVLVMTAVAPARLRLRLIGLASVVAVVGLAGANAWIGPCL